MARNIKTTATQDYDDAIATVQAYVEGLRAGSADKLAQAFHKDASMYGFFDGNLNGGPISNLYDFVREHGSAAEIKTHLDVLSMIPTTAVIRVDMENDAAGADYTDFHTLIKLDGRWQIIAKVFHKYDS